MKDMTSLHLKVQDLVSCYAQTDPLREMSAVQKDSDKEEAALKWVALAILHGINSGATQISISRGADGAVKVVFNNRTFRFDAIQINPFGSSWEEVQDKILWALNEALDSADQCWAEMSEESGAD